MPESLTEQQLQRADELLDELAAYSVHETGIEVIQAFASVIAEVRRQRNEIDKLTHERNEWKRGYRMRVG